jgi:hypothetical protein
MTRTQRPVNEDRACEAIVVLIATAALNGDPCPTREDFMAVTGVQQRRVWSFLAELAGTGVIEIESRGEGSGRARRMRIARGRWTAWTERKPVMSHGTAELQLRSRRI